MERCDGRPRGATRRLGDLPALSAALAFLTSAVATAQPPPPLELGLFGGIQGNDLGGSPEGARTGWTAFARGAYSVLPWFAVALEAGWIGTPSNSVDELIHVIPLRLGVDFGVSLSILHASVGARFLMDVWTLDLGRRQTDVRVGGGLFSTVIIFPWEQLGFGLMVAMELFPEAVVIRDEPGGTNIFALGWLRFLVGVGVEVRV